MRRVFRSHRQFLWILVLSLAKGCLAGLRGQPLEQHFVPKPLATEFLCTQGERWDACVSVTTCFCGV